MRNRSKLLLGALSTALVLVTAAGTASATRLNISGEGGIRASWTELEFTGNVGPTLRCRVTIEGTLHSRTISKVSGQLIGYITSATLVRPCTGFEGWILNGTEVQDSRTIATTLPWHIRYGSFTGTLPRLTGVRIAIVGYSWLLRVTERGITVNCLFKATDTQPLFGIVNVNETTGRAEGFEVENGGVVPKFSGDAACPTSGRFRGRGTFTNQRNEPITIRLVR